MLNLEEMVAIFPRKICLPKSEHTARMNACQLVPLDRPLISQDAATESVLLEFLSASYMIKTVLYNCIVTTTAVS